MADVQEPVPEGIKVFVGNLSFQVGREELEKEFSDAGNVLSANVIMRGNRSRGYGFVEMETQDGADKAVELLNHREIDGRPVNVEQAKPRKEGEEEKKDVEGGEGAPRRGRGRGRGGRGRGRGRRGRGGAGGEEEGAEPQDAAAPDAAAPDAAPGAEGAVEGEGGDRPRRARRSRGKGRGRGGARGARGGRGGRGGRGEGGADLREPSSDTLFVANLPFATQDEELKEFFKEYNPTKGYVVVGRNGRSKGFGFVSFGNNEDQQAALKLDGAECQERAIAVRVALNPEPREKEEEEKVEEQKEEEAKAE